MILSNYIVEVEASACPWIAGSKRQLCGKSLAETRSKKERRTDSEQAAERANHKEIEEVATDGRRGQNHIEERGPGNEEQLSQSLETRLFPTRMEGAQNDETTSQREIICAEAVGWLEGFSVLPGSVFTSLPDLTELEMEEHEYKAWFLNALDVIFSRLGEGHFAIFYQTDNKLRKKMKADGSGWVLEELLDKSGLCIQAAERHQCKIMWRKVKTIAPHAMKDRDSVVCRGATDALSLAHPAFSHLLCFARAPAHFDACKFNTPEIFPRGRMLWPRAIGINAAMLGVRFLKEVAGESTVTDPFCGMGTIPAAANIVGMSSVGVDLCPRQCELSRRLRLQEALRAEPSSEDAYRGQLARLQVDLAQ